MAGPVGSVGKAQWDLINPWVTDLAYIIFRGASSSKEDLLSTIFLGYNQEEVFRCYFDKHLVQLIWEAYLQYCLGKEKRKIPWCVPLFVSSSFMQTELLEISWAQQVLVGPFKMIRVISSVCSLKG